MAVASGFTHTLPEAASRCARRTEVGTGYPEPRKTRTFPAHVHRNLLPVQKAARPTRQVARHGHRLRQVEELRSRSLRVTAPRARSVSALAPGADRLRHREAVRGLSHRQADAG